MENIKGFEAFDAIMGTINSTNLPADASQIVGRDDDGNDIAIVKKTIKFEVVKGKRAQVDVSNPDIIKSVDKINAARKGVEIMSYVICREMANLAAHEEDLQKMGFDDVADFGRSIFGYSRNTVNQYVRVGKAFILPDYRPTPALPSTIPVSSMVELLAYVQKDGGAVDTALIANLYGNGILVDGMPKAAIRKALEDWKKSNMLEEGKQGEQTEQPEQPKEGKKRGRKSKAEQTEQSEQKSIVDVLNDMTPDVAAGNALNALEIVTAIFNKFVGDNEREVWQGSLDMLRDIARNIIK